MRELTLVVGVTLACSGCVPPPPQPVFTQVASQVAPDDPNCRVYSAQATIDGRPQAIAGRACRQTDGTWRIAEGPPGQTPQFATVYAPPPYSYYPYYDPWLWDWPIGLSLGTSAIFVDRDHRFHDFRFAGRHDGGRFGGFRGRFGGFHGGFAHGGGGHHG
jgi:hypothetical protein